MKYGPSANLKCPFLLYNSTQQVNEVAKEVYMIIKHHTYTMMTNNIQAEKSANRITPKSIHENKLTEIVVDLKAAWEFITTPGNAINYDDTLADLEDYRIISEESFLEIITKRIAEAVSKGLKTAKRKEFMLLCGVG